MATASHIWSFILLEFFLLSTTTLARVQCWNANEMEMHWKAATIIDHWSVRNLWMQQNALFNIERNNKFSCFEMNIKLEEKAAVPCMQHNFVYSLFCFVWPCFFSLHFNSFSCDLQAARVHQAAPKYRLLNRTQFNS